MDNQDWKPVILTNPELVKKKQQKTIISKPVNQQNIVKTDKDGEIIGIKKVSTQMAQDVVKGRIAKKMTQVDLAKASCLDTKIISEIERGNCIYKADQFNKICKVLGIKIERNIL
jgi:ribosome-binding protein aMBF1 (putative translation factor)